MGSLKWLTLDWAEHLAYLLESTHMRFVIEQNIVWYGRVILRRSKLEYLLMFVVLFSSSRQIPDLYFIMYSLIHHCKFTKESNVVWRNLTMELGLMNSSRHKRIAYYNEIECLSCLKNYICDSPICLLSLIYIYIYICVCVCERARACVCVYKSTATVEVDFRILMDLHVMGPPLWSSGQSSWLQIRRPGFDSRH
jgi:hypothetical protein